MWLILKINTTLGELCLLHADQQYPALCAVFIKVNASDKQSALYHAVFYSLFCTALILLPMSVCVCMCARVESLYYVQPWNKFACMILAWTINNHFFFCFFLLSFHPRCEHPKIVSQENDYIFCRYLDWMKPEWNCCSKANQSFPFCSSYIYQGGHCPSDLYSGILVDVIIITVINAVTKTMMVMEMKIRVPFMHILNVWRSCNVCACYVAIM